MQKLCQPFPIPHEGDRNVARETSPGPLQCYWIANLPVIGIVVADISIESQSIRWYDACNKQRTCRTYPIAVRSLDGMALAISNKQAKG